MRRQARISVGGALVWRTASALQVWLWLLIFIFQNEFRISRSIKPGYLDFDNLPETNFTCAGKVIGGYYADLETSCQMFHVCTVGQQEEPMDIKFLCLNGTVFDQETRVCERVDEVDCTKSEKFYSLNLELYGSTAPPIIQPEQNKPQAQPTEHTQQHAKPSNEAKTDPTIDDTPTTVLDKTQGHSTETADSTDDPVQDIKKDEPRYPSTSQSIPSLPPLQDHDELTEEYQEDDDDENVEYEEDYAHPHSTTSTPAPTTTTVPTTTTTKQPPTTTLPPPVPSLHSSSLPHLISSPSPALSSLSPSAYPSLSPSASPRPTLDPSLLSPQEFIYRHQGPGSEAISFQRHSYRPADGVYITHAPPQQFDHFQYESSRTAPRPAVSRPAPFAQRPQPAPFRPTTLDPRDQLLRPGPTFQPSERHETAVKHNKQQYPTPLPAQRPLPFNPFFYDRKRSDDVAPENKSSLSARSVAPPVITERSSNKPKSPPRVIVTASASVSDSNGKRLNYTVGNVVSAVKPIVTINYDDYKESDLILFDPFFLDVPKLQNRRKTRSNKHRRIITVPVTATVSSELTLVNSVITTSSVTSRATTTEKSTRTTSVKTTTIAWNPDDYVDDNYEPHAYVPPMLPLAVIVPHDKSKYRKQDRNLINNLEEKTRQGDNSKVGRTEQQYRPTSSASAAQTSSSQSAGTEAALPPPPPPAPLEAPACVPSRVNDCRTHA